MPRYRFGDMSRPNAPTAASPSPPTCALVGAGQRAHAPTRLLPSSQLYEDEIKKMESQSGNDVKFINPEPGFVVKTTLLGKGTKVFVNICQSDMVEKPEMKVVTRVRMSTQPRLPSQLLAIAGAYAWCAAGQDAHQCLPALECLGAWVLRRVSRFGARLAIVHPFWVALLSVFLS